jgi:hypothetical protein
MGSSLVLATFSFWPVARPKVSIAATNSPTDPGSRERRRATMSSAYWLPIVPPPPSVTRIPTAGQVWSQQERARPMKR